MQKREKFSRSYDNSERERELYNSRLERAIWDRREEGTFGNSIRDRYIMIPYLKKALEPKAALLQTAVSCEVILILITSIYTYYTQHITTGLFDHIISYIVEYLDLIDIFYFIIAMAANFVFKKFKNQVKQKILAKVGISFLLGMLFVNVIGLIFTGDRLL